jgi:tRNA uridine 5-carboxymethylaminomethyl modification enzyme
MKRPEIRYRDVIRMMGEELKFNDDMSNQITIETKYQGYINKAYKEAGRMLKFEDWKIPENINYNDIFNLASEAREKLDKVRPLTISQASRISGVNPSDVAILLVYLESRKSHEL